MYSFITDDLRKAFNLSAAQELPTHFCVGLMDYYRTATNPSGGKVRVLSFLPPSGPVTYLKQLDFSLATLNSVSSQYDLLIERLVQSSELRKLAEQKGYQMVLSPKGMKRRTHNSNGQFGRIQELRQTYLELYPACSGEVVSFSKKVMLQCLVGGQVVFGFRIIKGLNDFNVTHLVYFTSKGSKLEVIEPVSLVELLHWDNVNKT